MRSEPLREHEQRAHGLVFASGSLGEQCGRLRVTQGNLRGVHGRGDKGHAHCSDLQTQEKRAGVQVTPCCPPGCEGTRADGRDQCILYLEQLNACGRPLLRRRGFARRTKSRGAP